MSALHMAFRHPSSRPLCEGATLRRQHYGQSVIDLPGPLEELHNANLVAILKSMTTVSYVDHSTMYLSHD